MKKQRSLRLSSTTISVISQLSLNSDSNDVFNRNINLAILSAPRLLTILDVNKIKKSKQWRELEKRQKKDNTDHSVVTVVLNEDVVKLIESLFASEDSTNYSGTINKFFEGLNVAIKYYSNEDADLSKDQYEAISKGYDSMPLQKLNILDEMILAKYCLSGWLKDNSDISSDKLESLLQSISGLTEKELVLLLCRLRKMPV